MYEYWLLILNDAGAPMRVTVFADTSYQAVQVARAMYGNQLISESANFIG